MSTIQWKGDQPEVAMVQAVNVLTYDATTTYGFTGGDETVSVIGSGGSATTVAAALQAALAASLSPIFLEAAWTQSSSTITLTANNAGVPLAYTPFVSGGTGTIGSATTTTANSGPNDVALAGNWSGGVLPGNSDDVYATNSASGMFWNLTQFAAATFNSLNIDSTMTGQIGLPLSNSGGYVEFRQRYFQSKPATLVYGAGTGTGSSLCQLDLGSATTTVTVYSTGSTATQGLPALTIRGTGPNTLTLLQGTIGLAIEPGDTAAPATINTGYSTAAATDVALMLGTGVTLSSTTINQNGGSLTSYSSIAKLTMNAGTMTVLSAAAVTTLDVEGGTFFDNSTGTKGSCTIGAAGTIDATRAFTKTYTNLTCYGTLLDPNKSITFTNPISFPDGVGGQYGATVQWGTNIKLARS